MALLAAGKFAWDIGTSIFGASEAAKRNAEARRAYEEQKRIAQEIANKTNEYNKRVFAAEQQNYTNTRAYEWETAVRNWKYQQNVQDFQYLQAVKQYGKSVENTRDQLTYNNIAAMQAYESEQAALNEILTEDRFNRQGLLVEQLKSEGKAALGQAGQVRTKMLQASIADLGRNTAIMDASLRSSTEQANRNMFDIAMRKYGSDQQAKASMMIRPERGPSIPTPTPLPDRVWVEPMEVFPQAIQAPTMQSTWAPLISGISSALGTAAKIDFGGKGYDSPFKLPTSTYDLNKISNNTTLAYSGTNLFGL